MRKFSSPYIADWFSISLRWLTLFAFSTVFTRESNWLAFLPFVLFALWNLSLSMMAGLNLRLAYHRQVSVIADLLFALLVFWLNHGLGGPLWGIAILPILGGAIYYEFLGALLSAGVMALSYVVYAFFFMPASSLPLAGILSASLLFLGALFGFLSKKMIRSIRVKREVKKDVEAQKRRVENERIRAIYDLTSTLTATLSYSHVLEAALDLSLKALNPELERAYETPLVSAVLLFTDDVLMVRSARRFTSADMRLTFEAASGILSRTIDQAEPVLGENIGQDPELGRVIALRSCTTGYTFPLRTGLTVYGLLLFAHPDPKYFNQERRDLIDVIGRQAAIAMQNASLYQDLVEEKERMIEVQEEARKKLARDLHDGPTQSVSAIAMRINLIRMMLTKAPDKVEDELIRVEDLARRTTKEIRHMLFTLRPLVLESQGLSAALKSMAEKMLETYDQKVEIDVDEKAIADLEMGKQGVIFFLSEEAVNNARKHAKAPVIWVRLRAIEESILLLEIKDNGVGFDVQAVNQNYEKRGSLGMINLTERTELINGLLRLESAPGKGTNVQVFIPLTEAAADRLHRARKQ